MPQDWENGNAARQYEADTAPNIFAPVDYAARLQTTGRRRGSSMGSTYQPGQTYGAPSAPPMAAPAYEEPSYLQQQAWMPAQEWQPAPPPQDQPGVPYSAALFEHQPTAVMPNWEERFFAEPQQPAAPVEMPVWEDEAPEGQRYYARDDIPLRDPFTPAEPKEEKPEKKAEAPKTAQPPKQRPPIRVDRLLALIAAAIMLGICAVVGGGLVIDLVQNEREVKAFRENYLAENGVDVYHGAVQVELPPVGQTFVPTNTPSPTVVQVTPSPTPIIPIHAALGLNWDEDAQTQPQETPEPDLRTKQRAYPKNPMCNVMDSLREMVAQNGDVIGRLVIDGVLDEMVMQRNNTYYLTHNSIGATSEAGAVFADESCTLRMPPENLLLRGQSGVPGKTFAPLWQYISGGRDFVAANMTARLTTLYEEENYVLFAVIVANRDPASAQYFNYASYPTFTTDEEMLRYVETARAHSAYQFNVDVNPSDRLLTLATLGSGENTLVLLYRMVRDTENMGV